MPLCLRANLNFLEILFIFIDYNLNKAIKEDMSNPKRNTNKALRTIEGANGTA
jgi:hypothetical protein